MKLLYITSLSGRRVNGFMRSAIKAAQNAEYEFVMACNTCLADNEAYARDCHEYGISLKHINFQRNPLDKRNIEAYKQLSELMKEEHFDVVHCNTPVGGIIGRICSKNNGIRNILYQAHGFHFWRGAPLKNWLLYYPVEKVLSRGTDILITIAKDDYAIAKKMHANRVEYIHGVGVDFNRFKFRDPQDNNPALRAALGIPAWGKVILSVGELNENKNHKVVFDALRKIHTDVYYVLCGDGKLHNKYESYINENGLVGKVFLMGYRFDIPEFYRMADLFVFPSLREGIPGAIMEAIATGVTVVASDIRGVRDLVPDESYRFPPTDADSLARLIEDKVSCDNSDNQRMNFENLTPYAFDNVVSELEEIYKSL